MSEIKTLLNGIREWVHSAIKKEAPQANWNVNDPSDPAYVKGRTHWYVEPTEASIEGLVFTIMVFENGPTPNLDEAESSEFRLDVRCELSSPLPLKLGQVWKVELDGYDDPREIPVTTMDNGELALDMADKSLPTYYWPIRIYADRYVLNNYETNMAMLQSVTITGISGTYEDGAVVHPLDEKYIPDSVKSRTHWTEEKKPSEVLVKYSFETYFCQDYIFSHDCYPNRGEVPQDIIKTVPNNDDWVTVIYDDQEFGAKAIVEKRTDGVNQYHDIYIGNRNRGRRRAVDTGEPFLITLSHNLSTGELLTSIFADSLGVHSISCPKSEKIHPLDEKYIPKSITRTSECSPPLIVRVVWYETGPTSDTTFDEINEALKKHRLVVVLADQTSWYHLWKFTPDKSASFIWINEFGQSNIIIVSRYPDGYTCIEIDNSNIFHKYLTQYSFSTLGITQTSVGEVLQVDRIDNHNCPSHWRTVEPHPDFELLGTLDVSTGDTQEVEFDAPVRELMIVTSIVDSAGGEYDGSTSSGQRTLHFLSTGLPGRTDQAWWPLAYGIGLCKHDWGLAHTFKIECGKQISSGTVYRGFSTTAPPTALFVRNMDNLHYFAGRISGVRMVLTLNEGVENTASGSIKIYGKYA